MDNITHLGNVSPESKYREILIQSQIVKAEEILDITVSVPDNLKVKHVVSHLELVTVIFTKESGKRNLELFGKKILKRKNCPVDLEKQMNIIMMREGLFLVEFINELREFCEDGAEGLADMITSLAPRTLYCDPELIVMENLVKRGYVNWFSEDCLQDFDHAKLVLTNLAKFHAVTHLMIEKTGGKSKFLERHPTLKDDMLKPELMTYFSRAFEAAFDTALNFLQSNLNEDSDKTLKILKKYKGNLERTILDIISCETLFECVCHGNCSNGNIMFQRIMESGSNKVVFLDFQTPRLSSGNIDVGYFLFRSVEHGTRRRWLELLRIYFEQFQKTINLMDPSSQSSRLSFEDFVLDFMEKSKMGLFFSIFLITGMKSTSEEKSGHISTAIVDMVNDYLLIGDL